MKHLIIMITIAAIFFALMGSWTEANLEWALSSFKGEPVDVPYVLAVVLTMITNVFGLVFNIICEILKLAL